MNLTVSWRVFGGFAVVLFLSIILLAVSIFGIMNIGKGIQQVSTESVPTLIEGAALSESVLATELNLILLLGTERRSQATAIKTDFDTRYNENQSSLRALGSQLENLPELSALFVEVEKTNAALYEIALPSVRDYFGHITAN